MQSLAFNILHCLPSKRLLLNFPRAMDNVASPHFNTRVLRSKKLVKSTAETKSKVLEKGAAEQSERKVPNTSTSKKLADASNKEGTAKSKSRSKVVVKAETASDNKESIDVSAPSVKKEPSVSPQKRKAKAGSSTVKKIKEEPSSSVDIEDIAWQPENWRKVLDNILQMRKLHVAPVDSLGCEECPEKDVEPEVFRYQTLISVMLSSQTRDEVTFAATQRLIDHGLTVNSILNTPDEKIGELIYPAGFWKSKIKFIKNTTQLLKDQYNGDIPRTFKELCKLPGVGPKMANIVMSVAWKDTVGIAVDTHVHRISNRLGWVPKPTKDPEQTRKALESWLPKKLWESVSMDLVGFGQTICKPIKPKCKECLNIKLCPFCKST